MPQEPFRLVGRSPALAAAVNLGMQLAAGMALFAGLGYWLDRRRGGGVAFTLGGVLLALLYGGYEVWKVVRLLQQESTDKPDPHEGG
mgnify:CR=1 FL=1